MRLFEDVIGFIAHPDAARFEGLALEVFRYQLEVVPAYREFCAGLGVGADSVRTIDEIPAVSTLAFKYSSLWAPDADQSPYARLFMTSGTTIGRDRRGKHLVPLPEVYRASAMGHLKTMLFPDRHRMRILAIHPTADILPESSLSQMISWCIEEFGTKDSPVAADRSGVNPDAARDYLARAERDRAPIGILGTTAAFGALFSDLESCATRFKLAPGSRLMDTGGAKGQVEPLDALAVCEKARNSFDIGAAFVINEYGMTELCSQLYDATPLNSAEDDSPLERVKIAPPWMVPSAVDPATLHPVRSGEIGLLRFFDLANVGSVSAILTEDLGIVNDRYVRVIGRARRAEPRGCALAIREFERAEARRTDQQSGSVQSE